VAAIKQSVEVAGSLQDALAPAQTIREIKKDTDPLLAFLPAIEKPNRPSTGEDKLLALKGMASVAIQEVELTIQSTQRTLNTTGDPRLIVNLVSVLKIFKDKL